MKRSEEIIWMVNQLESEYGTMASVPESNNKLQRLHEISNPEIIEEPSEIDKYMNGVIVRMRNKGVSKNDIAIALNVTVGKVTYQIRKYNLNDQIKKAVKA